jgi:integrase
LTTSAYDLWLNRVCENSETSRRYREDIVKFERWAEEKHGFSVQEIPNKWREAKYSGKEAAKERFLDNLIDMVQDYFAYLKKIEMTHLRINRSMSVIMSFFHNFDIPFKPIRIRHPFVQYHNRDITKEEIVKILNHSCVRNRAIYLMLYETGMRPETAVKLRWKHIKEDFIARRVPMKIKLTSDILKCRVSERFVFIGEMGFEALSQYLMTERHLPLKDDDFVFVTTKPYGVPIGTHGISQAFNVLVLKLKLAEPRGKVTKDGKMNKPKELRLYTLRKAFSKFMAVKVDRVLVEYWLGHTSTATHDISEDPEYHRKLYAQGYPELRLEAPQLSAKILEDLKDKDGEIQRLKTEMEIMKTSIEQGNSTKLQAKDIEIAQMRKDVDTMMQMLLNLKPLLADADELKELLRERAWQKEQKARAEREVNEQKEKELARKELGL